MIDITKCWFNQKLCFLRIFKIFEETEKIDWKIHNSEQNQHFKIIYWYIISFDS